MADIDVTFDDDSIEVTFDGGLTTLSEMSGDSDDITEGSTNLFNATHTGEVTGAGALTIAANVVTYAKMQNVAADQRILGNIAGAGQIVTELTVAQVLTMLGLTLKEFKPNIIIITEAATINQDVASWLDTRARMLAMTRTATALNFTNLPVGGVFHLSMTKNNSDQDLTFTLGGANLVYNIFDSASNILSRGTAALLSGTDSTKSFVLSFYNTGIAEGGNTVIEVSGTIESFS